MTVSVSGSTGWKIQLRGCGSTAGLFFCDSGLLYYLSSSGPMTTADHFPKLSPQLNVGSAQPWMNPWLPQLRGFLLSRTHSSVTTRDAGAAEYRHLLSFPIICRCAQRDRPRVKAGPSMLYSHFVSWGGFGQHMMCSGRRSMHRDQIAKGGRARNVPFWKVRVGPPDVHIELL
jgi:hypothetical protein